MTEIAIIGGSGFQQFPASADPHLEVVRTPYGDPSGPLVFGSFAGEDIIFLHRHGEDHTIPPHLVNYRANLRALKEQGVRKIIALNAVGAIHPRFQAGDLALPDQIIDYTHSREHTFFGGDGVPVTHIDFTYPYCVNLRELLINEAIKLKLAGPGGCCYAATQGPRFESIGEIARIEQDGGDLVGMTGMPEAALARELEMCYASIAIVVNPAAGKAGGQPISMAEIQRMLDTGVTKAASLIEKVLSAAAGLQCQHPTVGISSL